MKKLLILFLLIYFLLPTQFSLAAIIPDGGSDPVKCAYSSFKSENDIFQDYQSQEYVDGYLRINFKLKSSPAFQVFYPQVNLFNPEYDIDAEKICARYGGEYYDWGNPPTISFPPYAVSFSLRFISSTHFVIWNNDTDTKFDCPLCDVDFSSYGYPENLEASFSIGDYYGYDYINSDSLSIKDPNPVPSKTPVLIVPGIMGTEMSKGSELLWADVLKMVNPINSDNFMDPLAFNSNLAPSDINVSLLDVIRLKEIQGNEIFNYADGLINEFKSQEYKENETLFAFPYDWRYGVSGKYSNGTTNADLFKQKIDSILAQTGAEKVDIIAHSMGGLIVKKYVMENQSSNRINKAVFVGVPNLGAPEAIKVLMQGDNMDIPFLNDAEIKKISKNMPGSYDLLPSQKYYDIAGSYFKTVDMPNIFDSSWKPGQDAVTKDFNYGEFNSFLADNGFNSTGASNSQALHSADFDGFDLRTAGISLYSINGCRAPTMSNITQTKSTNILGQTVMSFNNLKYAVGDKTVPITSASSLPINTENKYYALKAEHGKMPSADGIRQEIVNLIAGSNLTVSDNLVTQDVNKCQLNGKAISVFSPVNITITDQDGNKMGLSEDGSIINEIPNASFDVLEEHKFLFLPIDSGQTYTILMQGTGIGTFTIKTQDIAETLPGKIENFINIPVSTELTGQINLGIGEAQTTLTVKQNPTAETQIIYPSATLTADQLNDFIAPVSTVTLTGEKDKSEIYTGEVGVKIIWQDPVIAGKESQTSGILNGNYNLDDAGYQKVNTNETNFTVSGEGKHKVVYFAVDKNGNTEAEKTLEFEIKFLPAPIIPSGGGGGFVGAGGSKVDSWNPDAIVPSMPVVLPQSVIPETAGIQSNITKNDNKQILDSVVTVPINIQKPPSMVTKTVKPKVIAKAPIIIPKNTQQNNETMCFMDIKNQQKNNLFLASLVNAGKWLTGLISNLISWK